MTTFLAEMSAAQILDIQSLCKIVHIIGAFMLIIGMAVLVMDREGRKTGMVFHGVGMILVLLGGFGWLGFSTKMGKMNPGFDAYKMSELWVLTKIVIWLIFGIAVVLAKKRIIFRGPGGLVAILVLGAVAITMAVKKPFRPAPENAEPQTSIESFEGSGNRQDSGGLL